MAVDRAGDVAGAVVRPAAMFWRGPGGFSFVNRSVGDGLAFFVSASLTGAGWGGGFRRLGGGTRPLPGGSVPAAIRAAFFGLSLSATP
ncbi:MAG: hypothetical protein L0Y71_06870 [Gemmataceae bacterium]|nr:hypothetical protein [Gemmataceae bacterium]